MNNPTQLEEISDDTLQFIEREFFAIYDEAYKEHVQNGTVDLGTVKMYEEALEAVTLIRKELSTDDKIEETAEVVLNTMEGRDI